MQLKTLFSLILLNTSLISGNYNKPRPEDTEVTDVDGLNQFSGDSRIIGGMRSKPNVFPWLVSLGNARMSHNCGGVLVSNNAVLTAGHCVTSCRNEAFVRLSKGSNLNATLNTYDMIKVIRRVRHREYLNQRSAVNNDIAVWKLERNVNVDFAFPTLELDSPGNDIGRKLVVAGWGQNSINLSDDTRAAIGLKEGILPLMQVDLFNQPIDQCKNQYPNMDYGLGSLPSVLCAGNPEGGKDSCQGDSGGPLMAYTDNGVKVIGIVSFGKGCALKDTPAIYSRLSYHKQWLLDQLSHL